jgi:hypothetical protein
MKNKNYFFTLLLSGSFLFAGIGSRAQSYTDAGKPIVAGTHTIGMSTVKHPAASCDSMKTTFAAGNGNTGVMFDIVADSTIYITDFDVLTINTVGVDTMYLYYKKGSCQGYGMMPAAWTKADSMPVPITSAMATDTLIFFNRQLNHNMVKGDTLGIYITYKSRSLAYTNGTAVDSVSRKKSTITVLQDYGIGYKFASVFMPRKFNGIVNFCAGVTGINKITETQSALFPNPMSTSATLAISNGVSLTNAKLVISDISGRVVKTQENIFSHTISINRDNLSTGMYFYTLTQNNKVVANGKLIIN